MQMSSKINFTLSDTEKSYPKKRFIKNPKATCFEHLAIIFFDKCYKLLFIFYECVIVHITYHTQGTYEV